MQGFVMNMQPSEAEVGFDLRLPPTADIEQIKRRVKEEWAPAHKNLTYEVKISFAIIWITENKPTSLFPEIHYCSYS